MTTLVRLEEDIADTRRAGDGETLSILTLLLAKIQRIAKDDRNRDIRNEDVIQGVARYRKEVEETKKILDQAGRSTVKENRELDVTSRYLPIQMTADELDAEIEKALDSVVRDKRAIGIVMKHLNSRFRGQFDPKITSELIGKKLAG